MTELPDRGIPEDALADEDIDPPLRLGIVAELRAAKQFARLGMHLPSLAWRRSRRGNAAVVVIPGIHSTDVTTLGLRRFLTWLGHDVRGWGLGRNDADPVDVARCIRRLDREVQEDGRPRVLVGWSLGGLYAREIARRRPDLVSKVVTYGSPIIGGAAHTVFARSFQDVDPRSATALVSDEPVPVPATVIYSRADRVVAWRACLDHVSEHVRHVEVRSTHVGMLVDPDVWRAVADVLADAVEPRRVGSRGPRRIARSVAVR